MVNVTRRNVTRSDKDERANLVQQMVRRVLKPFFCHIAGVSPALALLAEGLAPVGVQPLPQRGRLAGAQRLGQFEDRAGLRGDGAGFGQHGRVEVGQGVLGQVRGLDRPGHVRHVVGRVGLDRPDIPGVRVDVSGQPPGAAEVRPPVRVVEAGPERGVDGSVDLGVVHAGEVRVAAGRVVVHADQHVEVLGLVVGTAASPLAGRSAGQVDLHPVLPVRTGQAGIDAQALVEPGHQIMAHRPAQAPAAVEQPVIEPGGRREDARAGRPSCGARGRAQAFPASDPSHIPSGPSSGRAAISVASSAAVWQAVAMVRTIPVISPLTGESSSLATTPIRPS